VGTLELSPTERSRPDAGSRRSLPILLSAHHPFLAGSIPGRIRTWYKPASEQMLNGNFQRSTGCFNPDANDRVSFGVPW